jgi:hypothetical protein
MSKIDKELCKQLLLEISDRLNEGQATPIYFGIVIYSPDSQLPFMTASNDRDTANVATMFSLAATVVQRVKPFFKSDAMGEPVGRA